MVTPRLDNWERRFKEAVAWLPSVPFEWGSADCACVMAEVVEALSGIDPMERYRHRYTSAVTARALVALDGFDGWKAALGAVFASHGWPEIDPRAARVGDIGFAGRSWFCVRLPKGFALKASGGGWGIVTPKFVRCAWAIGG